jgi:ribonuclease-3
MAASDRQPAEPLLHGDPLRLGHTFARPELLAEALTHRSALDRQPDLKAAFPHANERLEFLGDRVLALAMADLLLHRFPNEREGHLGRRYAALVSAATLTEIGTEIDLGPHLRLGDSQAEDTVRPAILADAMEAVLGAVFLDAGFATAAACVERLWGERLSTASAAPRDAKTTLQEWAQARRLPLPAYREVGREGPAHAPVFVVDVSIKGHEPSRGRAGNKREAERLAAVALLELLGVS